MFKGRGVSQIIIVSDSQNCINKMNHRGSGKDDALIAAHERADNALHQLHRHRFPTNFINLRWVRSHTASRYNDEADRFAKVAASFVTLRRETSRGRPPLNPTQYIGLTTAKGEAKALIQRKAAEKWIEYRREKYDDPQSTAPHLFAWKVPYFRDYEKELVYLNDIEADVRMMLYTNNLPLNMWLSHHNEGKRSRRYNRATRTRCCSHCKALKVAELGGDDDDINMADGEELDEDIWETPGHLILDCPQFDKERAAMLATVDAVQRAHNLEAKDAVDLKPIEFEQNIKDPMFLKQMVFPQGQMRIGHRMLILKAVIRFIIRTKRIQWVWDKTPPGKPSTH